MIDFELLFSSKEGIILTVSVILMAPIFSKMSLVAFRQIKADENTYGMIEKLMGLIGLVLLLYIIIFN